MSTNADCIPGSTRVTRPLWILPAKEYSFSRSWKISTSRSSSRIATFVSCLPAETISSLDMHISRWAPFEELEPRESGPEMKYRALRKDRPAPAGAGCKLDQLHENSRRPEGGGTLF